ncbi:hypothetical protein E3Q19_03102 [Wallemia mellicola]|nr:hypothetical protein E3Q19_03102 [Wallemia mellicola]
MTLPALELKQINLKLKCLNDSKLSSSPNSAVLTPAGFILIASVDSVYCLPLMEIDKQPRIILKKLKDCHSIRILPLTSVILLSVEKSARYYDLRQVDQTCLKIWDISTKHLNVLPDLRTPAPPALELNYELAPPTPTTPPFTTSPSLPNIASPALPPLPFQIEADSSLFNTATPLRANASNVPLHQRRNARQPRRLDTPTHQTPPIQHTRSRSEELTPLSSDILRREMELRHTRHGKSDNVTSKGHQSFRLSYRNLSDVNEPSLLRTAETTELSYLATLSLTPPDNETKQPADQTTVSLFAGTQHAPLSLVKAFILPDKPVDMQLSIKGDEMSEIILVYDKSIFALNPFSIHVREIKVGKNGRRRRNHAQPTAGTIQENLRSQIDEPSVDSVERPNEVTPRNQIDGGPLPNDASVNTLASTISANNSYTNFTPPLIDHRAMNTAPTRRQSTRFGSGLSRWTSLLQRPFLQRPTSTFTDNMNVVTPETEIQQVETPSPQQDNKKIVVNPHYTTFIQLQLPPPLPAASLEKMFTLPPRYDDLEAQKSRSIIMNKNASQISTNSGLAREEETKRCWFYLDPRGIEHGPWSSKTMQNWYTSKRFLSNLPIRHQKMRYHKTLTELISQFGAEKPFIIALGSIIQQSPANSLKSLDPPTPLLPPISLISDPSLPQKGPQNVYLVARRNLPTMLVDQVGRSIVRGSGIHWDYNNVDTHGDIKQFEMISTSDDGSKAAIVAIRDSSFEVLDIADALLSTPSEREKALPGWEANMSREGRRLPYVHRLRSTSLPPKSAHKRAFSSTTHLSERHNGNKKVDLRGGLQDNSTVSVPDLAKINSDDNNNDTTTSQIIYVGKEKGNETVYFLESYNDGSVRIVILCKI